MADKEFNMDEHMERMRNILNKRNNPVQPQQTSQPSMLARIRSLAATRNNQSKRTII